VQDYSIRLPELYLIDPRLLEEKSKPTIICDAEQTLHFVFPGTPTEFT